MKREVRLEEGSGRPGCLRTAIGTLLLLILAPWIALQRFLSRWRRGTKLKIHCREDRAEGVLAERLWLDLDAPPQHGERVRRGLSELMVRSAEALQSQGDSYHLVYREPGAVEPTALPLGPRIQNLGERFALGLSRSAVEGCTLLWLVLPAGCALASVLDPQHFDPEDSVQMQELLRTGELRWAVALTHRQAPASTLYRMLFCLPKGASPRVRCGIERLEARLEAS